DHRTPEHAGRATREVRPEHGDDTLLLDVADGHAGLEERRLEREGASEDEGHEVVAPLTRDVWHLGRESTVPVDSVLRDVRPKVGAARDPRRLGVTRIRDLDEGTRARIALAEDEEVVRLGPGKDHEVPLHVSGREPRSAPRVASLPDGLPDLFRRLPELHCLASWDVRGRCAGHYGAAFQVGQRAPST